MIKNFKFWLMLLVSVFILSVIAGCSSDNDSNANADTDEKDNNKEEATTDKDEEITIRWAHQWGADHFWNGIGKDLGEKFPHITIEVQEAGTDHTEDLERLIAAKKSPDIVSMGVLTHTNFLEDLGLAYNMDELIKESGFDLDRLEPSIVQYARNQDPNKEDGLYEIPNSRPTWSLHYNKDVFDTLGVEYPTDGMTWEEVLELAKALTREVGGVQYRGLDLDVPYDAYTQFSQNSIDPETNEVLIAESEAYRRHLEFVGDVVAIPGNYPTDNPASLLHNWGSLFGEGNIAMAADKTNWMDHENVGIATYPVWEGYEGLNPVPNGGAFAITEPSEHKEAAMEIIKYLLSDEYQMKVSKAGGASILVSPEIHAVFGVDNPDLDNKNTESLFKNDYATGPAKKARYGDGVLWTAPIKFIESGKDINEFLRILQEEAEENVRTAIESE
ncbi:extracellular solute-binding protein [Sporosarcina sp. E16_3]|uniref:ABC transporter substrate-binding protein n=1 Tax=Sporosarcina sp. E16_3 TaxID=2789293 RepID=UPI001A913331|nr:extracellular solute-binding protein [Sporosarcina sp. E16_3]MBO0600591.1 extracellular solute-binding protein [Sporosarcina sp. E16_3]